MFFTSCVYFSFLTWSLQTRSSLLFLVLITCWHYWILHSVYFCPDGDIDFKTWGQVHLRPPRAPTLLSQFTNSASHTSPGSYFNGSVVSTLKLLQLCDDFPVSVRLNNESIYNSNGFSQSGLQAAPRNALLSCIVLVSLGCFLWNQLVLLACWTWDRAGVFTLWMHCVLKTTALNVLSDTAHMAPGAPPPPPLTNRKAHKEETVSNPTKLHCVAIGYNIKE